MARADDAWGVALGEEMARGGRSAVLHRPGVVAADFGVVEDDGGARDVRREDGRRRRVLVRAPDLDGAASARPAPMEFHGLRVGHVVVLVPDAGGAVLGARLVGGVADHRRSALEALQGGAHRRDRGVIRRRHDRRRGNGAEAGEEDGGDGRQRFQDIAHGDIHFMNQVAIIIAYQVIQFQVQNPHFALQKKH